MEHEGLFSAGRDYSRRDFCRDGVLLLLPLSRMGAAEPTELGDVVARIGLVTDLHSADKDPAGSRHYRESRAKLAEAGKRFRAVETSHVVELGDLIDAADSVEVELNYLRSINGLLKSFPGENHYVLGNHCVDTLTKEEFLGEVEKRKSYYSFDESGFHFVILDACFRSDGVPYQRRNFEWTDPNIPEAEVEWLRQDLAASPLPTVVFAHQRLDVGDPYGVKNAEAVRKVLEQSGRVRAVFQGHSHMNAYQVIEGIHYVTLVAMVEGSGAESSGYSVLGLHSGGALSIEGFRKQDGYQWGG